MTREMKDSGIEWIGEIPSDWDVSRLKSVAICFSKGNGITKEDILIGGDTPCVRYGEIYSKYNQSFSECVTRTNKGSITPQKYFSYGDILFVCTGELAEEIGKSIVYLGNGECLAGGDIIILKHTQNPTFLNYALNSTYGQAQKSCGKTKLKVVHISATEIGNIIVALPSIMEQQTIAEYLDKKCAEIDIILDKNRSAIEEYKKLKQTIITQAVTKGIHDDRPMKDSGISWIGETPSHWVKTKVKWLLSERKDRSEFGNEEPLSMSQKYGLIPTRSMDMVPNMASSFVGAKLVQKQDLVFNKLKAHLGVFSVSNYAGLVNPDYAVYYSSGLADVKFLEYLFKTPQYITEFKKKSTGIAAGLTRLYTDGLYSIYCVLPPLHEQLEIVNYLNSKTREIDSILLKKEQCIAEIEAYKKSLIYEYVTGKKEV